MSTLTLDAAGATIATVDLGESSEDGYFDDADLCQTGGNLYVNIDGEEYGSLFFMRSKATGKAGERFAELMAVDAGYMGATMTSLQCSEADALVGLVRACGWEDAADALAEAHADGDEFGDVHYPEIETEVRASELVKDSHFREFGSLEDAATIVTEVKRHGDTMVIKGDCDGQRDEITLDADEVVNLITYPRDEV